MMKINANTATKHNNTRITTLAAGLVYIESKIMSTMANTTADATPINRPSMTDGTNSAMRIF